MTRQDKINYLSSYIDTMQQIEAYKTALDQYKDEVKGGFDRTGKEAVNVVYTENAINECIARLDKKLCKVKDIIESIPIQKERTVLTYLYLCGFTFEKTGEIMGYSVENVRVLRNKALEHYT